MIQLISIACSCVLLGRLQRAKVSVLGHHCSVCEGPATESTRCRPCLRPVSVLKHNKTLERPPARD